MILIEKTEIMGLEPTIRGMRNPMNSWDKSDSIFTNPGDEDGHTILGGYEPEPPLNECGVDIGPSDLDLMLRLARAGSVDGKFRRMIAVYVDITAPLYWWKEFDTYKVGTVANSCSTMHKIHAKEFDRFDFSHEHMDIHALELLDKIIEALNRYRNLYNNGFKGVPGDDILNFPPHDKTFWRQMIQLLPSSYNQKRTVMLNYEVLANIYQHRRNHKLDEWRELCRWIEGLPYSEVITCNVTEKDKTNILAAAIAKLKGEQWSEEEIANLLLGQSKKEQLKLFADSGDVSPIHRGTFDIPAVMADGTKNY